MFKASATDGIPQTNRSYRAAEGAELDSSRAENSTLRLVLRIRCLGCSILARQTILKAGNTILKNVPVRQLKLIRTFLADFERNIAAVLEILCSLRRCCVFNKSLKRLEAASVHNESSVWLIHATNQRRTYSSLGLSGIQSAKSGISLRIAWISSSLIFGGTVGVASAIAACTVSGAELGTA